MQFVCFYLDFISKTMSYGWKFALQKRRHALLLHCTIPGCPRGLGALSKARWRPGIVQLLAKISYDEIKTKILVTAFLISAFFWLVQTQEKSGNDILKIFRDWFSILHVHNSKYCKRLSFRWVNTRNIIKNILHVKFGNRCIRYKVLLKIRKIATLMPMY